MSQAAPFDSHPALMDSLRGVRRKARALSVLRGLGLVLAAGVGLVVLVALLDYALNLPLVPRLVFLVGAVAFVGWVLWNHVARPLSARLTLSDVAGLVESRFPQLEDHVRSTVDFVRDDVPGSPVMKQRTVARAASLVNSVDVGDVLLPRPVLHAMGAALLAVAVAAALWFAAGSYARISLSRLLMGDAQWPKRQQIEMARPLPEKVAVGQRLDVRMRLAKGDKDSLKAIVYYRYDNGHAQQQIMTRNEDGTFTAAIDARGEKMTVWMKAGDDQTEPRAISVVQRLNITSVEARVTPPPYSKLDPVSFNLSQAPASVTVGSSVELTVSFSKPLAEGRPIVLEPVREDMKLPAIQWKRATPAMIVGTYVATESIRFRIRATDVDYFQNPGLEEYDISVRPDQLPSVMIQLPRGHEDRVPEAYVNLEALAEDDFEISTMTLVVERQQDKKLWEIPLGDWERIDARGERRRFRVRYTWELKDLKDASLKPGDVLEYCIRVTDNYQLNGAVHEPVSSGKLKILIISQDQLSQQVTQAIRSLADRVRMNLNAQNRTRQETDNLRKEMQGKNEPDAGDRTALNRLGDQQSTLTSQTKQVAGQMADIERRLEENRSNNEGLKDITREVKNTLGQAAENSMSPASQKLSEAAQHADPRASRGDPKEQKNQNDLRDKALEDSSNKQQQASNELGKALEKMDALSPFDTMIQKVREALAAQQALSKKTADTGKQTIGKNSDQLTPEEKKALEDIAKEQKDLANKTEQLAKELDKGAQQTQKSDPGTSKAMQQAAQQAQQQQVASNQSQASQAAQQNQQAQAQAKQKMAELGLQMMLDTLREAERRKLEQLAKELAKLQELIAHLIERQAGHNVDNLRMRGGEDLLKQITDDLLAKAARIRDRQPAVPRNDQLMLSQAQTENNTRDVAKTAESVPKAGAEIAATLTNAAGQMERATVNIKVTKLPEAYDPFQVKALAALEDAKAKADKAAAEAQDKIDAAQRETIRQAYEKIRADQEKLNVETARIDGAERLPDGGLKRDDSIALGRLPGQQGALSDQTKKLEEALSALGGVVYVWANNDIVNSMNDVKVALAKPDTAKPTQIEQKRIVDQLDAMIRNLATKPKQSEMYGGGGGGGQGQPPKPKLPAESELRLLKELQIAINNSTKLQNAQPKPDQPRLVALGGRQGELRNLLDQLLKNASEGKVTLGPEPDPKQQLPEEASNADIENQEFDEWLLGGKDGDKQLENDLQMAGKRMARSRRRLALDHDPGKTTQAIQDRILDNLDHLIEMARQQQAKSSSQQQQQRQQAQKAQQNNMGQQQTGDPQQNQSQSPASSESRGGSGDNTADLSRDIRAKEGEWGHLTPRERQAIIDGLHDRSIPKYKQLIDDYYEMLSKKGGKAE